MYIITFDLHSNTCQIGMNVPVSQMKLREVRQFVEVGVYPLDKSMADSGVFVLLHHGPTEKPRKKIPSLFSKINISNST